MLRKTISLNQALCIEVEAIESDAHRNQEFDAQKGYQHLFGLVRVTPDVKDHQPNAKAKSQA